jgi:hypothetical protein
MKIVIGNYRNHWLSPYIILEKFFYWRKNYDAYKKEPPIWLQTVCKWNQKFLDTVHPKIEYIKIDPWDTWSMDHTLAPIILPMLKELQKSKQGAPYVDDADVPDELKSMNAPRCEEEWDTDDNWFKRWDWILQEMVFAFEAKITDNWMAQFITGESDVIWVESDEVYEGDTCHEMKHGPNHTQVYDWEAIAAYEARIQNGFEMFGKYYRSLWS